MILFIFKFFDDKNIMEFKDEKLMIEVLEINEMVRDLKLLFYII